MTAGKSIELVVVEVLRAHWSFNDSQRHTHSWHDREDFIRDVLPVLLRAVRAKACERCAVLVAEYKYELGQARSEILDDLAAKIRILAKQEGE
jgi:hypothetical protein